MLSFKHPPDTLKRTMWTFDFINMYLRNSYRIIALRNSYMGAFVDPRAFDQDTVNCWFGYTSTGSP